MQILIPDNDIGVDYTGTWFNGTYQDEPPFFSPKHGTNTSGGFSYVFSGNSLGHQYLSHKIIKLLNISAGTEFEVKYLVAASTPTSDFAIT